MLHYFERSTGGGTEVKQEDFALFFGLEHAFEILHPKFEDVNRQFECGWTPLTAAAVAGENGIVGTPLLVRANAEGPALHHELCKGMNVLHIAAKKADEYLIALLLASGASSHARSSSEPTPLYRAARSDLVAVLEMLYDVGANIDALTCDKYNPLSEAVIGGHPEVPRSPLEQGAYASIANDDGHSPLNYAHEIGLTEKERGW